MGDNPNRPDDNPTPTPEELKQEEEALKEAPQEEIRNSIIEKYGLNEDEQLDLIDNLVNDTLEQRKSLGKAIKQKRDWRTKAQTPKSPEQQTPNPTEPPKPEPEKDKDLSTRDAIVLMKAGVDNDEDIDEVVRYAKFQNISINKALESKTMKTILAERQEERTTADVTNTKGGRRGQAQVSNETVLDNARKGQFPDDPAKLAEARWASKVKSK